jgi:hypothetical protein
MLPYAFANAIQNVDLPGTEASLMGDCAPELDRAGRATRRKS